MKNDKQKTDKEQFVEDYVKIMTAGFGQPPEQENEAIDKAIKEVWERRRREKAARLQEEGKSKK
ncbi:MAG TPA: hypothetical protein VI685_06745 [Candidatus Angelobacter sp.]